jgi:deoxyribodipyrimidine photo-lyase
VWVFGNHDRPFYDREVFGTVRSMTASGLKRKADMDAYIAKVESFRQSDE